MSHLSEQELVRRESLKKLRELGIDPYPAAEYVTTHHTDDIKNNFDALEGTRVALAGRMMSRRIMG